MKNLKFTLLGGDKRNIALAKILWEKGHTVKLLGFGAHENQTILNCNNFYDSVEDCDVLVGPIPLSHDNRTFNAPFHNKPIDIEEILKLLKGGQVFMAGVIKPPCLELAKKLNVQTVDLLEREEVLVKNAIPTAEGAIKIAIEETDITLHGSQVLLIGYGRIGKILARMLQGLGAQVTAVVNKSEAAANASAAGCGIVYFEDMETELRYADVIFNTVPKILLTRHNMRNIRKDTVLVDLASPPYGVDNSDAHDFGLKVIYANSLPGKIASVTAAQYLYDAISHVLAENSALLSRKGGRSKCQHQ